MKKYNVIFTGHFLKIWYALFVIVLAAMIYNSIHLRSVDEFDLTVYDRSGAIISEKRVSKDEVSFLVDQLPVTKSFKPVK
jgi:hypothetical protein